MNKIRTRDEHEPPKERENPALKKKEMIQKATHAKN